MVRAIADIGWRLRGKSRDHGVVVIGPREVLEVNVEARDLCLQLLDVVLDGLNAIRPNNEGQIGCRRALGPRSARFQKSDSA